MRKIPDNNLSYPVLISAGDSIGTGFFLNATNGIYLVTACHVIYNEHGCLRSPSIQLCCYPPDRSSSEKTEMLIDLTDAEKSRGLQTNLQLDVSVVLVFIRDKDYLLYPSWLERAKIASGGLVGVPLNGVRKYSDVMISNEVYVLGYPVSLGLPDIPQLDYARPLLRSGIVAGKNDALKTIILDCSVYPGNSGGPALEVENTGLSYEYKVIGVVSQFVPAVAKIAGQDSAQAIVNSGYSVVAAMDSVLELLFEMDARVSTETGAPRR